MANIKETNKAMGITMPADLAKLELNLEPIEGKYHWRQCTILLMAQPGRGKTTLAASIPNCHFISTDGGAEFQAKEKQISQSCPKNWDELKQYLRMLLSQDHNKTTVVIDLIDDMYDYCIDYVKKIHFNGNLKEFNKYGIGFQFVQREFKTIFDGILRAKKFNLVLCGHIKDKDIESNDGSVHHEFRTCMSKTVSKYVMGITDIAIYLVEDNNKREKDGSFKVHSRRKAITTTFEGLECKDRTGKLPLIFDVPLADGWKAIDKHYPEYKGKRCE